MKKQLLFCTVMAAILLFFICDSCKKDEPVADCPDCPVITSITPASGLPGDSITITGKNFEGLEYVLFDGVRQVKPATSSSTPTKIKVATPDLGKKGAVRVQVARKFTSGNGDVSTLTSEENLTFTYKQAPVFSTFSPVSGKKGDVITLTGRFFGANPRVFFHSGEAAEYLVKNDTFIQVKVPAKAGNGTLRVTTDDGASVNSATVFTYQYQYSIGLFLGAPGAPGFTINVPAIDARLIRITKMAGDAQGNMYVVDQYNNTFFDVLKVDRQAPYQVTLMASGVGICTQIFLGPQLELYYVTDLGSPSNETELYRTLPGQASFRLWGDANLETAGVDPAGEVYVLRSGAAAGIYKYNGGSFELTAGYPVSYFTGNTFSIGNNILFDKDGGNIKRLDLSTKQVTDLYPLSLYSIHAWAYSPLGDQVYFANNNTIKVKNGTAFDADGGSTLIPALQNILCFYMGADAFGNLYIRKFDTAEEPCIYKVTVE